MIHIIVFEEVSFKHESWFYIPNLKSSRVEIYALSLLIGSQIILSTSNSNRIQEHKYLREKPFLLERKNYGTNSENFYYYQINYSLLSYTLFVSRRRQYFAVSSLAIFLKVATLYSLFLSYLLESHNTLLSPPLLSSQRWQYLTLSFLLRSSQAKIPFFSLGFMLYFSPPKIEDLWTKAKANKFFVALSIYKTLFLFSFELGIHYFFNKE